MHKVIIISGSPRKDGNTMDLLHIAAEEIKQAGCDAEVISLAGKEVNGLYCLALIAALIREDVFWMMAQMKFLTKSPMQMA